MVGGMGSSLTPVILSNGTNSNSTDSIIVSTASAVTVTAVDSMEVLAEGGEGEGEVVMFAM